MQNLFIDQLSSISPKILQNVMEGGADAVSEFIELLMENGFGAGSLLVGNEGSAALLRLLHEATSEGAWGAITR